ncbi:flagellar hook-associated protein FlgL [Sporolactobacillus sp. THM7-4]|nr:flagellar hook-associated protein FlgL [Sporolactobacillus sp. THM7-4]
MRITQSMMTNSILRQISSGYGKVADYQDQLASGKKITRPSQDPVVATMGISYRTDVSHIDKYEDNVSTANKWIDSSGSALSSVNDVLNRIRELTVEASNDTYGSDQRAAVAKEVDQLTSQIVTIGNTQVGGQYIFSGKDTQNVLLTEDSSGNVSINAKALANPVLTIPVNDGMTVPINVDPGQVFSASLFSDLKDLRDTLNNPDSNGPAISAYLDKIDRHLDAVTGAQTASGGNSNRISMIKNRLDTQKTIATKIMSNNEDADYAETIVKLNQQQNVYTAALSVGARIIQTSLVDFLK